MSSLVKKTFSLEVKEVKEDGSFEGYASVFGNLDTDGEVVDKGAFKRTLDHSKGIVPILWQHDRTEPIGWNASAIEDGYGLKVSGRLDIEHNDYARKAYGFLKMGVSLGAAPGLSVGFMVPKDGSYVDSAGHRHFKQISWKEYSVVTFPANEAATVSSVKENKEGGSMSDTQIKDDMIGPDDSGSSGDPMSFEDAMASHQAQQTLEDSRYAIERGKNDAIDSIKSSAKSKSDKKMLIHKAMHAYADHMTDWHGKAMDVEDQYGKENGEASRIKGMNSADHMALQRKLASAKADLFEAKAMNAASTASAKSAAASNEKGLGKLLEVWQGYARNDVNLPIPMPAPKENSETTEQKNAEIAAAELAAAEQAKRDSDDIHSLKEGLGSILDLFKK